MSIYLKKIFFSNSFKSIDSIRFKYKSVHIFTIKFSFQKLKKDFPIGIIFIESFTQKNILGHASKKGTQISSNRITHSWVILKYIKSFEPFDFIR